MSSAFTVVLNPYNDPYGVDRPGAMLTGKWVPGTERELHDRGITALYLNVSRGWAQSDFSFLCELPWLEELNIIFSKATGLQAIESLTKLQRLSLTATTRERLDTPEVLLATK